MDNTSEPPEQLSVFFEPDGEGTGDFVAGVRTSAEGPSTVMIRLPRDTVERAVLLETELSIFMSSDGTLGAQPDEADFDIIDEMHRREMIATTTIDQLVQETLEIDRNEPSYGEDGVVPQYRVLRDSLTRALALVDSEINHRASADPTHS